MVIHCNSTWIILVFLNKVFGEFVKLSQTDLNEGLRWASENGHVEVVKLLQKHGAKIYTLIK